MTFSLKKLHLELHCIITRHCDFVNKQHLAAVNQYSHVETVDGHNRIHDHTAIFSHGLNLLPPLQLSEELSLRSSSSSSATPRQSSWRADYTNNCKMLKQQTLRTRNGMTTNGVIPMIHVMTRHSENDHTPQPLDQWKNSPFMCQQVGNCKRWFTFTHYLADLLAMHHKFCKNCASVRQVWVRHRENFSATRSGSHHVGLLHTLSTIDTQESKLSVSCIGGYGQTENSTWEFPKVGVPLILGMHLILNTWRYIPIIYTTTTNFTHRKNSWFGHLYHKKLGSLDQ